MTSLEKEMLSGPSKGIFQWTGNGLLKFFSGDRGPKTTFTGSFIYSEKLEKSHYERDRPHLAAYNLVMITSTAKHPFHWQLSKSHRKHRDLLNPKHTLQIGLNIMAV